MSIWASFSCQIGLDKMELERYDWILLKLLLFMFGALYIYIYIYDWIELD